MKIKAFFVAALSCLTAVLVSSGTASAGSTSATPPTNSFTAAAWPSITAVSSTPGHLGAAAVITCTPNVQSPHNSTHVPGTVNVVVTLSCTAPVPRISIRAALYRNGNLVKDSGAKDVLGARSAQNNAAEPCHAATYQGWMSYFVQFPAGYVPPTGASSGFGPTRSITC